MERIPVTVIGGYLGAGKSTLLNRLLHESGERRLAVIVNDFGDINIDIELIESRDNETINLANGCVCCSIGDDLATVLFELSRQEKPPEQIVIEASGVASPASIARYGNLPGLCTDATFVVVDAEQVRSKAQDRYVGATVRRQISQGDVLILNKIDLVGPEERQSVLQWLHECAEDVQIVESLFGNVPLGLLICDGLDGYSRHHGDSRVLSDASIGNEARHVFESWSHSTTVPLDENAFRLMVQRLPDGILRGKGILRFHGSPHRSTVFQLVGKRWSLELARTEPADDGCSRLVMIGLPGTIDEAWLARQLDPTTLKDLPVWGTVLDDVQRAAKRT